MAKHDPFYSSRRRGLWHVAALSLLGLLCAAPRGTAQTAQAVTAAQPLLQAAAKGDAASVRALLAHGAAVNATAADGRSALIVAVEANQPQVVDVLIASGANLDWTARPTGTALNVAENAGQTQLAAALLAAGAHTTGKSVGDTVCVQPWGGQGFCGVVRAFTVRAVTIELSHVVGCTGAGCAPRQECSASHTVGGPNGLHAGDTIMVPSWCMTQTGVQPGVQTGVQTGVKPGQAGAR